MSPEEYFAEVDELLSRADQQADAIPDPPELDPSATFEERKQAAVDSLSQQIEVWRDLAADVEELDPPDEVERLHNLYLGNLRKFLGALDAYTTRLEEATTEEAFSAALLDAGTVEDAKVATQDICIDLQDAASEHDLSVDLGCASE